MRITPLIAPALAAVICSLSVPVSAQTSITATRATSRTFRVDGGLRDWAQVRMQRLGSGEDASMEYALAYSDENIYLAARVHDDRMVRTRRPGNRDDAIVLTLVVAGDDGPEAFEVWLYAGVAGSSAASARVTNAAGRTLPSRGIRVIEAPLEAGSGYELEAQIPLELFPHPERFIGARAALRLVDVDAEANPQVESAQSTAEFDPEQPSALPELTFRGGAGGALAAFRRDQSATGPIRFDMWGDVAGDEREERVLIIGTKLVIVGDGYREGRGYDFEDLGLRGPEDVQRARLEDITGDGKAEIIMRLRERDRRGLRCNWMVMGSEGSGIYVLFGAQVFERTRQGIIRATVQLRRQRRGPPFIDIQPQDAEPEPDSYRRPPVDEDAVPIMLPWGEHAQVTYRWNGQTFEEVEARPNPNHYEPPTPAERAAAEARAQAERERAEAARQPTVRDLSDDAVIARVRRDRGIASNVPARHRASGDIAEGREPETALSLGGAVVVYGPGFANGQGYFYYEVAPNADDLRSLQVADVTGDGKAELLVTYRQHIGEFQRDILLVLRFDGPNVGPVLQVEVARYHGDAENVVNEVSVRGSGRRALLRIDPGDAHGWSASTWPFEGFADDGVGPLLLPWQDRAKVYRFQDGALVGR